MPFTPLKTKSGKLPATGRHGLGRALAAAVIASALGGCSASVIDSIPTWAGGEPAGTPERPIAEPAYPPVNDRPPPRDSRVVTEEEQARIEAELAKAREAQAARAKQVQKDRDEMLSNTPQPPAPASQASGN